MRMAVRGGLLLALCVGTLVFLGRREALAADELPEAKPASEPARDAAEPKSADAAASNVIERADDAGEGAEPASEEPPAAPRLVVVHIEGDEDIELQMFDREANVWRTVCRTPCDAALPAEETYRIDAPGVRTSNAFQLDTVSGDHAVLQIDTASSAAHAVGVGAIVVGATPVAAAAALAVGGAAILGIVMIIACPFVEAFGGDFGDCAGSIFGAGAREYGKAITHPVVLGVLGGGIALGVTGIVLTTSNGSTDVAVTRPNTAFLAPEPAGALPLPRATAYPIFTAVF